MRLHPDYPERLDRFVARVLPEHSRSKLTKLIDQGIVLVDGAPQKASFMLHAGMAVDLDEPPESEAHDLSPADIPLEIVFEDADMLVVNKPRGLAAHPASSLKEPSLVNALLGRKVELSSAGGDFRPGIVHRLDKETTGLMVVAKNDASHVILAKQMESKSAERRYFAVVAGNVEQERFTVAAPLGRSKSNRILMAVDPQGKPAVTHVKRLGRIENGFLVACRLETGRTHQIRVHLRAVGFPVIGDALYAPKEWSKGPLQLHAAYLALNHPVSGERIEFYAAPDEDFYGRSMASRDLIDPF
jgi:23S rRNA pseudouridine1911/1915/1917 synthase